MTRQTAVTPPETRFAACDDEPGRAQGDWSRSGRQDAAGVPVSIRQVCAALARPGNVSDIRGIDEGWVAPIAVHDAPHGFGEEVWISKAEDSVLAWIIGGGEVICEFGKSRGARAQSRQLNFTLHAKGNPAHFRAPGRIRTGQFVVPPALLRSVAEGLGLPRGDHTILRDDLIFAEDAAMKQALAQYSSRAVETHDRPSRVEMEARAILIVERLLSKHHRTDQKPALGGLAPRVLRRVTDYMMANLCRDVSLADLADLAGLSPFHFAREFKRTTGLPPHAWLTQRRIEAARDLMVTLPESGLTEIALRVGYESQAAFGTAFKRLFGASPGQWRRSQRY